MTNQQLILEHLLESLEDAAVERGDDSNTYDQESMEAILGALGQKDEEAI